MNQYTPEQLRQIQEIEKMKKVIIRKILTKEAIERLGRVRIVNPNLVTQLELYLLQLYQSGQIQTPIDDAKLKQILDGIVKKKDFNIKRG